MRDGIKNEFSLFINEEVLFFNPSDRKGNYFYKEKMREEEKEEKGRKSREEQKFQLYILFFPKLYSLK